jgi:mannose-6-phosphate isomerase-like protein (cupin superfamily)
MASRKEILGQNRPKHGDIEVKKLILAGAFVLTAAAAFAQQPTCKMCPGTYIPSEEVQAYINRAKEFNIVDQQVRAVDVGKSNLAVGLVYRGKLDKPAAMSVAEHDQVSELYHIIEGTGTLVLGPEIVGAKRRPADSETVRMLNGPGQNAATINNGVTYNLKPGDVVIIPAGTGHWFTKIDDHIVYLMVRIDPDKVTPAKTEADSKQYLAKPPADRR